ncbi:MAG: M20/M25/M40 family metallo-hydrolase [Thermoleophilia bacterium]|nr:M20/M25/M40 family metallo-hydrolase [Thermoleophilia bacterium]
MRELASRVERNRLVETACDLVDIPSPTGHEQRLAEYLGEAFDSLGLHVAWQEVEDGRPNVVGTLAGTGGGKSLMFNGHTDTSYSGREPWLQGRGFKPQADVSGGEIYGLGISNMKGALACYVEAVRALRDARIRLQGDLVVAAVVGEIEKTQWGEDFRGKQYRGYAAGSRHLVTHGGIADMCVLGEPTELKLVLGHYGAMWLRISTRGEFVHTAFAAGRLTSNAIVRLRDVLDSVLEWVPQWEERASYRGQRGVVNVGAVRGGFPWRLSRTPGRADLFLDVRVPPTMPMTEARAAISDVVARLRERHPEHGIESEIYVTAPGAEIADDHELVHAVGESHRDVFGRAPEHDAVRWFSDASVLARYGVATLNYGPSSGLPGGEGESMEIRSLVDTARVYALTAARVCGVA